LNGFLLNEMHVDISKQNVDDTAAVGYTAGVYLTFTVMRCLWKRAFEFNVVVDSIVQGLWYVCLPR